MRRQDVRETAGVRDYYDRNTRLFLRLGFSSRAGSIHRSLWPPGVRSLDQALNVSNQLILDAIPHAQDGAQVTVADLGCGVGGSVFYLARRLNPAARLLGLTISPIQARLARRAARQNQLDDCCQFLVADFQRLPLETGIDFAYSVEAFAHAGDPAAYFSGVARALKSGGRLALIDDFRSGPPKPLAAQDAQLLATYQRGWQVPGLAEVGAVERAAAFCGLRLVECRDLTPLLHLRLLPLALLRAAIRWGWLERSPHPLIPSTLGSIALQHCLNRGLVRYQFLVFEKSGG